MKTASTIALLITALSPALSQADDGPQCAFPIEGIYDATFGEREQLSPDLPACPDVVFQPERFELWLEADGWRVRVNEADITCASIAVDVDVNCTARLETECIESGITIQGTRVMHQFPWGYDGVYDVIVSPQPNYPTGCASRVQLRAERVGPPSNSAAASEPSGNAYGNLFANTFARNRVIQAYPSCSHQASGSGNGWNVTCPGVPDYYVRTSNTQAPGYPSEYLYMIEQSFGCPSTGCQIGDWSNKWQIRCKSKSSEQPCVTTWGSP